MRGTSLLSRVARIALWLGAVAGAIFVLDLLGVPVGDWIHKLIHDVRTVPASAIVAGVALDTVQTTFAALAWLTILRAAFPDVHIGFRPVLAAYAVAVGLNGFLPANLGTLVMMIMLVSLIAGASFGAILSGFVVQKIPFTVFTIASYIYLFATVAGSLSLELGFVSAHPAASALIAVGGVALLWLAARVIWARAVKFREQIKSGAAVLGQPRRFMIGVFGSSLVSYLARLGIVAVFLAAYSIPVSVHSVIAVTAANSISSSLSVTPGGAGVTQALNVVVLDHLTDPHTATAYSVAQQLIITAWDVLFAVVLVAWVFGWSGGKQLVRQSYAAAGVKRDELKAQREAARTTRRGRWRRRLRAGDPPSA